MIQTLVSKTIRSAIKQYEKSFKKGDGFLRLGLPCELENDQIYFYLKVTIYVLNEMLSEMNGHELTKIGHVFNFYFILA